MNAKQIYKQFIRTKEQLNYIDEMYHSGAKDTFKLNELTDQVGFVEAAYELLDEVKAFINSVEEADPNMDLKQTSLESVDEYFSDHPVTEYMQNNFNIVVNAKDSDIDVKKLAESVQDKIMNIVAPQEDNIFTCEKDCTEETCSCPLVAPTLYEYISNVDESVSEVTKDAMDLIQNAYAEEDAFTEKDVELIRFFLSKTLHLSVADVMAMTDDQVVKQFKVLQLLKSK
ncbi:hypothetical protein CPT_Mater207 [Bacillus phage Mater]|uniref:Uncharacterized protein n=1 Tax=Bacillus phage Mater TaxID=1540090 RepID=A0A0A0RP00_9CAUD|nr:transcriptional regulator [Bacillus phage Mater]AIW03364.1 hypothetical protein CPT_Mater207 [Bacillus phage Mater]